MTRGVQGSFIVKPFRNYKKFHEYAVNHQTTQWHKESLMKSTNFNDIWREQKKNVCELMDSAVTQKIESNRKKLVPIISSILFLATHDLPLRGKTDESSVFVNLLKLRVEAGDSELEDHLKSAAGNAKYTSHRIQNEIISIARDEVRSLIIDRCKNCYFSILADETADISGVEQLSIGIRFIEEQPNKKYCVKEEFLGFVPLDKQDAKSIAEAILTSINNWGLNLSMMVGQGYDGCSTMSGKFGGVQKLIKDEYPLANFFHCSSHKLNLVINDLNKVQDIRNTIGTIKSIISFFRESTLRRSLVHSIPLLSETRWSSKYKSIRIFKENFCEIIEALETLTENSNSNTKQKAHQLCIAATTSAFIVSLHIIAHYSSILEPVTNILQGIDINFCEVKR